jgi:hypothetical protein
MNFVSFVIVLVITIIKSVGVKYYLSTRISKNDQLGWSFDGNVNLSKVRANDIGNVLNPTDIEGSLVKGWSQKEFMNLWIIVIKFMNVCGKTMISYKEDVVGSKGCRAEVELARKIGMPVIEK